MDSTHDVDIIQSYQNNAPSKVNLTIHHQFPGVELASPVYASDGASCYLSPDYIIDVGSTMQTSFNIDFTQDETMGALSYKLQRKNIDEFNEESTSSEEETTCIQLVVIWEVDRLGEFRVISHLIEYDKDYVWDRNRLMKLAEHYKSSNMKDALIEETWLMYDNTVLMTIMMVARKEEYYELEIIISKTSMNENTRRPWYIDLNT
jgi:hypothetical protein